VALPGRTGGQEAPVRGVGRGHEHKGAVGVHPGVVPEQVDKLHGLLLKRHQHHRLDPAPGRGAKDQGMLVCPVDFIFVIG